MRGIGTRLAKHPLVHRTSRGREGANHVDGAAFLGRSGEHRDAGVRDGRRRRQHELRRDPRRARAPRARRGHGHPPARRRAARRRRRRDHAAALARPRGPRREPRLEHWIESAVVLAPDGEVRDAHLPQPRSAPLHAPPQPAGCPSATSPISGDFAVPESPSPTASAQPDSVTLPLGLTLAEASRRYVEATVAACDGHRSEAAKRLAIGRNSVTRTPGAGTPGADTPRRRRRGD